jgi:tRNA dimethylallyltransferase
MNTIAIIGSTASGKSDLAFDLAQKINGYILSLDSLSVYKQIDIAAAKPTIEQLNSIRHFGINEVLINEPFSIMDFIRIYYFAKEEAESKNKPLIIVGGSSFYLKSMIDGISPLPTVNSDIKEKAKYKSKDLEKAYDFLYKLDKKYMQNIKQNDRYRITRAFEIYLSTNKPMSVYFELNKREVIIKDIDIYNLFVEPDLLRDRIKERTISMVNKGLIEEVELIYKEHGEGKGAMKSIGVKETIKYIKGETSKEEMIEEIYHNTTKLAKRQRTFNRTQFKNIITGTYEELQNILYKRFEVSK